MDPTTYFETTNPEFERIFNQSDCFWRKNNTKTWSKTWNFEFIVSELVVGSGEQDATQDIG